MAVRSKQDRRKQAASGKKSVPPAENKLETPKSATQEREVFFKMAVGVGGAKSAAREREAAATPKADPARSKQTPAARHGGTVRKSTFYLAAVLCLLMGAYLGSLLPALRGSKELVQQSQPQQAPNRTEQDENTASHLKRLEEAVKQNPQDLPAWIQLGNQYFDDNKPRDAIRAYERALAINGDNPDVLTDMGIMYRQLGEFERAAEKFTQAGTISPLHEQSRFNLGVVLFFDLNRKDEARKVWRSLLNINPEAKTPDGALLRIMLDELK